MTPPVTTTAAYAAPAAKAPLERTTIERRPVGEQDVLIEIKFAGICHSDIHQVNEGWGEATFPMVPGHEIAGIVTEVGSGVTKFAVGDRVFHMKFGNGNVSAIEGNKLTIDFDRAGQKRVLDGFVNKA